MGEVGASSSKHHMIGGDGPNSYARNSAYQKELLVSAEDLVRELISKHVDTDLETFRIADLGCSVGPNAFLAVDNIIAAVEERCGAHVPEFQVFFNDLIGNDFNTLFKLLPPSRNYLAAAAPGSFHGRLFPRGSIHLAHCSTALHWLSAAPEKPNKGRIHYSGAGKDVRDAYRAQYERDMDAFLSARGLELVPGGLVLLLLIGFPDGYLLASDSSIGHAFHTLGSCLYEMAKMGKIGEEEVDSFNLPFYYPSRTEVEAVIVANGVFDVERVAEMGAPMRRDPDAASVVSHMRAVVGVLVEERFGSGIVEQVFELHLNKLLERPILDHTHHKETIYFLFLKRKAFS
ncbi:loganic acid O-methyltransferase-like [Salvia miltiorrhiza]|uniref:loganic acid O-methyltransferase-like n=1 Tax=Salvia miltiorrhiza TaxID=226208 RepID=UPI0025ABE65F|nr:loganic acid O-methyltransferase-like [Salvia miltiorrhiza]